MSLPGCECMSHVPGKDREGLGNVLMLGGGRGDSLGTRAVSSGETGPGLRDTPRLGGTEGQVAAAGGPHMTQ